MERILSISPLVQLPKGFSTNNNVKANATNKAPTLNPNAAEFIPFAHRESSSSTNNADTSRPDVSAGKAILNRSESSVSNTSDDEALQYWCQQLPDDITPDFKSMGEDQRQGPGNLSIAGLSIHDAIETSRLSTSAGSNHLLSKQQERSSQGNGSIGLSDKMRFPVLGSTEGSASYRSLPANPWDEQAVNSDQHLVNGLASHSYIRDSSAGFLRNSLSNQDIKIDPLEFLASKFPGLAVERLADLYFAKGCDLKLTVQTLAQFQPQLQVDVSFNQNLNLVALSAPNLSVTEFPTPSMLEAQNSRPKYLGNDGQEVTNQYRSIENDSGPLLKAGSIATSFDPVARRITSQGSDQWKYGIDSFADVNAGLRRSLQVPASHNIGRSMYGDRLLNYGAEARAGPVWLDSGAAVGNGPGQHLSNAYLELRDEAREHARLRNACLEQARRSYLNGNNTLANELSVKAQLHNMQMKAAHVNAGESIYRRNPVAINLQSYGRMGNDQLINLPGCI